MIWYIMAGKENHGRRQEAGELLDHIASILGKTEGVGGRGNKMGL